MTDLKTTPRDSSEAQNPQTNREPTFGEKAVGASFNPSKDPRIDAIKAKFAALVDELNDYRASLTVPSEAGRYYSKSISFIEDASANAVKGLTWQY